MSRKEEQPDPQESFALWRKFWGSTIVNAWRSAGDIPSMLLVFIPRLTVSYIVVAFGQMGRAIARLFGTPSSYEPKANLRILIITDYMPPQTHGIAIRFRNYIDNMRRHGHEVQVFSTNITKDRETSFDHPNLPAIVNPFNTHNKMSYNPGVKLSYYLGAKQWDLVHLVYPSNIGVCVLPVCAWRRIPVYCSHHVDMEYYIDKYMRFGPFAQLGGLLYWGLVKLPAVRLANVNAAPTLTFLDSHLPPSGKEGEALRRRIPSGVVAARFMVEDEAQRLDERREILRIAKADTAADACVWLMVQRLAPEKSTMSLLEALHQMRQQGVTQLDGRPIKLVIAGDGPARKGLEQFASTHALPVTFVGNLSQTELPPLYRAADLFVTCSTSETYGLTVLEALACGTPVVLPHCGVFDELWAGRIPDEWRYRPTEEGALPAALRAASAKACKERLQREPIKASWADAADELLEQYHEAIQKNLPYRQQLSSFTRAFNQLARGLLLCLFMWWLLKEYTIEISLLASHLLGIEREEHKRKPFWQPLKPFLRMAGSALRALGED